MIALLFALACGGGEPAAPAAPPKWGDTRPTQQGRYQVEIRFEPEAPKMGELFSAVAVAKTRAGEPIEDAIVKIDAQMPQHGHGMETRPIPVAGVCAEGQSRCKFAGGVYRSDGFKFHMGGEWTVVVDVDGPDGLDNASFRYEMR